MKKYKVGKLLSKGFIKDARVNAVTGCNILWTVEFYGFVLNVFIAQK